MYLSYMCGVKSPCTSIVCYLYILALNVFPGHLVPCVTYRDLVPCTFLRGRATTVNTQPYVSRNEKGASTSINTAIPYQVPGTRVPVTSYLAASPPHLLSATTIYMISKTFASQQLTSSLPFRLISEDKYLLKLEPSMKMELLCGCLLWDWFNLPYIVEQSCFRKHSKSDVV